MINYTKINRILFGLLGMLLIMFFWFLTMSNKGIVLAIFKAITSPQKQCSITIEKEDLTFALPQKTGLIESGNDYKKFITFTSGPKLYSDYYKNALPNSGWNFVDQMGSAFFYEKNGYKLTSTRRGLIWNIEIISFYLDKKAGDEKKDLALKD